MTGRNRFLPAETQPWIKQATMNELAVQSSCISTGQQCLKHHYNYSDSLAQHFKKQQAL